MALTRQQIAGGIVVVAGLAAAWKIAKDAPEMSDEDVEQAKKAGLGFGVFAVVAYAACKHFKWGVCKEIGAG